VPSEYWSKSEIHVAIVYARLPTGGQARHGAIVEDVDATRFSIRGRYRRVFDWPLPSESCRCDSEAGRRADVTIRGIFASKVVGMSSSMEEIRRLELIENCGAKAGARTDGSGSGLRERERELS